MGKLFRIVPLLMLALLAMAFAVRLFQMQAPELANAIYRDPMLGKPMPALELVNLTEGEAPLSLAAAKGPYLFNVFASWCGACRIEHTQLQALKEQSGLPLYGMAYRDEPQNTRAWLDKVGNIYDNIGSDLNGNAAIELGLTGAPETYLVDADGTIMALYRGAISEAVVEHRFMAALKSQPQEVEP